MDDNMTSGEFGMIVLVSNQITLVLNEDLNTYINIYNPYGKNTLRYRFGFVGKEANTFASLENNKLAKALYL